MSARQRAAVRKLCTTKSITNNYPRGCMANTLIRNRVTTRSVIRGLGRRRITSATTSSRRTILRGGVTRCSTFLAGRSPTFAIRRLRRTVRGIVSRCTNKVKARCRFGRGRLTVTRRGVGGLRVLTGKLTTTSVRRLVFVCRLGRHLAIYLAIVTRLHTHGRAH